MIAKKKKGCVGGVFFFPIKKHCLSLRTVLRQDEGSYQKRLLKLVGHGFCQQLWRETAAGTHCQGSVLVCV